MYLVTLVSTTVGNERRVFVSHGVDCNNLHIIERNIGTSTSTYQYCTQ